MPLTSHAQKRASTIALAIIVTCQLMVVLDATVVNIALVPIKHSLHFSSAGLSWVCLLYTSNGVDKRKGRADVHDSSRWCVPNVASPGMTRWWTRNPVVAPETVSISPSSKNTLTVLQTALNVGSRSVMAMPGGPVEGDVRKAVRIFTARCALAEACLLYTSRCV